MNLWLCELYICGAQSWTVRLKPHICIVGVYMWCACIFEMYMDWWNICVSRQHFFFIIYVVRVYLWSAYVHIWFFLFFLFRVMRSFFNDYTLVKHMRIKPTFPFPHSPTKKNNNEIQHMRMTSASGFFLSPPEFDHCRAVRRVTNCCV